MVSDLKSLIKLILLILRGKNTKYNLVKMEILQWLSSLSKRLWEGPGNSQRNSVQELALLVITIYIKAVI